MAAEIIALRCPSCGNPSNVATREVGFGYEFACGACSTVSVVIANNRLYVIRPGEHICSTCGRVAESKARFCQCGKSLLEKCVNCEKEIFVDNKRCESCGWPQEIQPKTQEGYALTLRRALEGIAKFDWEVCRAIERLEPPPVEVLPQVVYFWRTQKAYSEPQYTGRRYAEYALIAIGPTALPYIIETFHSTQSTWLCGSAVDALGGIGAAFPETANSSIALLVNFLKTRVPSWPDPNEEGDDTYLRISTIHAIAKMGSVAIPTLIGFVKDARFTAMDTLRDAFADVGPRAIPALDGLCGWFATSWVKGRAKDCIAAISARERKTR